MILIAILEYVIPLNAVQEEMEMNVDLILTVVEAINALVEHAVMGEKEVSATMILNAVGALIA